MCHDVIPLACSDWCILAASSALVGGGGVGIGGRGGEGVNFPQIETSKCERSTAWGRFRAQANMPHTCSTVNLLALMSRLPAFGQFWCFKGVHELGISVMVLPGLMETQWGGKDPSLIMYVYSIFPLSSVTYQGREKEGGSREKDGVIVSGRLSVSQIVLETCWDELNRKPTSSCQQAKLVLVLEQLYHMLFHSI